MEETLDIGFGSTRDDHFEPRSICGRISQNPQECWATLMVATFIECVDGKDESMCWLAREATDAVKQERALHGLWSEVWIVTKAICYERSKRGEDSSQFSDQGRKDILVLAQIWIVPPAEKRSCKLLSIVEACTERMSQRRFPNSR